MCLPSLICASGWTLGKAARVTASGVVPRRRSTDFGQVSGNLLLTNKEFVVPQITTVFSGAPAPAHVSGNANERLK